MTGNPEPRALELGRVRGFPVFAWVRRNRVGGSSRSLRELPLSAKMWVAIGNREFAIPARIPAEQMISGLLMRNRKGERLIVVRRHRTALPASSRFDLTIPRETLYQHGLHRDFLQRHNGATVLFGVVDQAHDRMADIVIDPAIGHFAGDVVIVHHHDPIRQRDHFRHIA